MCFSYPILLGLFLQLRNAFSNRLSIRVARNGFVEDECASVRDVMPNVTVLYVNLEKRTDRRQQFEPQLQKYFGLLKSCRDWDWSREVAFDMMNVSEATRYVQTNQLPDWMAKLVSESPHRAGMLGCYLSHLDGVKKVGSKPARAAFMFEDDFEFTAEPAAFWSKLQDFSREYGDSGWDVLLLGHNQHAGDVEKTKIEGIQKLKGVSWTTSSYLVNPRYIPSLTDVWKKHLDTPSYFPPIDEAWNELQEDPNARWFKVEPRLGRQRQSFSDIEQYQTTYGVLEVKESVKNRTRIEQPPVMP